MHNRKVKVLCVDYDYDERMYSQSDLYKLNNSLKIIKADFHVKIIFFSPVEIFLREEAEIQCTVLSKRSKNLS